MPQSEFTPLIQQASWSEPTNDLDDLVSVERARYTTADIEHRVRSFALQIRQTDFEELIRISGDLALEARQKFQAGRYESALELFIQCLGYHQQTHGSKTHSSTIAATQNNIASCLHQLGDIDAARTFYGKALRQFQQKKSSLFTRMVHGNVNGVRAEFVRKRLLDISNSRKPDGDTYVDSDGKMRSLTEDAELEAYGAPLYRGAGRSSAAAAGYLLPLVLAVAVVLAAVVVTAALAETPPSDLSELADTLGSAVGAAISGLAEALGLSTPPPPLVCKWRFPRGCVAVGPTDGACGWRMGRGCIGIGG